MREIKLHAITLQSASLYQIKVMLADIQARAYSSWQREFPDAFTILLGKINAMFLFLYHIIEPSLSRYHQAVTIMNLKKYCLLLPWLKTGTQKEYLSTQLWWVTAQLIITCLSPINPVDPLLISRSRSCNGHEMLWSRRICFVIRKWT